MPATKGWYYLFTLYEFDSSFGGVKFHGTIPSHISSQKIQIVLVVNNSNILFIHLIEQLFKHYPVIVNIKAFDKSKPKSQVL